MQETGVPPRILVVDDEPGVRRLIERTFLGHGYRVYEAETAAEAFSQLQDANPQLVLLDIQLPDISGLELCRQIRAVSAVPIIMITGLRNENDVIAGLQAGADDYVTKPFSPRELVARVEASLRRRALDTTLPERPKVVLDDGQFVLDYDTRSVRVGDREERLTPREFAILGYLGMHAGRVVPHGELIHHVWGESDSGRLVDLRTYVKLIRRKIEPEPSKPRYLQSRARAGYILPTP
jgi:two-component system KDP operon response regulator KdpE